MTFITALVRTFISSLPGTERVGRQSKHFCDLLKEIKRRARSWKYSGEVDLLLLNARKGTELEAELDFSTVVAVMINRLKADEVIGTVPELFEQIFEYADSGEGPVTAEGFSDQRGLALGRAWLAGLVDYIPAKAGVLWKKGRHFAVVDLSES